MLCFPSAKINLGLNIISKRCDGYHNIETVFYPIGIKDALEIVPSINENGIFKQSGIQIDGDPVQNLVIKAYRLMKEKYPVPELDVYLRKNIPFGAGLGGGSSDAAFMLKLINEYVGLALSIQELELIAAGIGADCPFFIRNRPVFATGTGNIFEEISLSLAGYYLVIVKPQIHISTKEAYSMVRPCRPVQSLPEIIKRPVEEWKDLMFNDFEESVFAQYPVIREIKQNLYLAGAVYASMSGSGSAVFGLFNETKNIDMAFCDCEVFNIKLEI